MAPPPRTLLVCRPDRVGDVIIATSCLEPLRRQLPDTRLVFAAREVMRPLLENHPLLDGFVATDAPLASWQADAVVHLHPDEHCQRAARDAGIPRRIGYRHGFFMDRLLTDRLPDRRDEGSKHEAEYNFDLLAPLGVRAPADEPGAPPLRPRIHLPESWQRSLRLRLAALGWEDFAANDDNGGYAVLNPTAFSPDLRWPAEHFAWLARELLQAGRFARVLLVAERVDDPSVHTIRRWLGPGVPGLIDLSGATNLAELGWLLRSARMLVSRNTGTTHLAAAVGCPTVELFGRLEPRYGPTRWRALGERVEIVAAPAGRRRWHESRRAFWRRGHAAIPREEVLAAALLLSDTRPTAGGSALTQETLR